MKAQAEIFDRKDHVRIEIKSSTGEHLYSIVATDKGLEITSIHFNGDMIIRPKTSNQVVITVVDTVSI